ncbi:MAG TPA: gephyrin-like molybdotransferase Glp [Acidocella sp.]|jgi:molybdopterin molybdotransferase|uniref:molybdopterin molybdotransferase MoeA n=1 Tax=Acidocella sp. TaxID=50710 RepID=UPI002CF57A13|nr:gephyrin-like molybdotransferase Glp [Acidocella sp.]HVE22563.1 gephyrin-like molybdotransferase Glp [Acidocella sp.]
MISVDEARRQILEGLQVTGRETVPLAVSLGRVLAVPVAARLSQPPADVSAMDGYAVRAADAVQGAALSIIGEAPAGHPFGGSIGAGQAVRLFTGSFVPPGADAILLQENATAAGGTVTVNESCVAGKHIRRAGQDFHAGAELIAAGRRLTARDVGLAAAGNHPWLQVHRRPRIAILATGDEISLPGEAIGPGGIVSSNAHMLAAFVTAAGGDPVVLPIAGDDLAAIAAGADAARGADLLVTTGGASVGVYDLVQPGLQARGLALDFWKIAMRPGKPLMFGRLESQPLLGLPGNPVSAYVCAVLFLGPAIARMSGLPAQPPETERARLTAAMAANDRREDYVRAGLERGEHGWLVTPFPVQDSGMLSTLARADALIRRPAHQGALVAGAEVEILRF